MSVCWARRSSSIKPIYFPAWKEAVSARNGQQLEEHYIFYLWNNNFKVMQDHRLNIFSEGATNCSGPKKGRRKKAKPICYLCKKTFKQPQSISPIIMIPSVKRSYASLSTGESSRGTLLILF